MLLISWESIVPERSPKLHEHVVQIRILRLIPKSKTTTPRQNRGVVVGHQPSDPNDSHEYQANIRRKFS